MGVRQRRIYLIKKAFQLRYALILSVFILLTALISCLAVYLAIFPYLSEKLANVYPQARLAMILRSTNVKVLFSAFLMIPFAIWFSIIISHRIAGPWYRLETILRDMVKGDFSSEIRLRKGDELQSLADSLNDVIKSLRESAEHNIGKADTVSESLTAIEKALQEQPVDAMKINLLASKAHDALNGLKESFEKHTL